MLKALFVLEIFTYFRKIADKKSEVNFKIHNFLITRYNYKTQTWSVNKI